MTNFEHTERVFADMNAKYDAYARVMGPGPVEPAAATPSRCERCNARRKLVQVGIFEPQWVCWACATGRNAHAGSQPVIAPKREQS